MISIIRPTTVSVLLVDDRPENLLSLEELLGGGKYELVRALSGNEALRLMLKQSFALVLMDVQMPDMDGFETAELMRTNPKTRDIPIIFITAGLKEIKYQFKGYDAGAVDYLAKPIEPVFLQSKVRIFTELYSQRCELELHKNHLEELVAKRTSELHESNEVLNDRNNVLRATEGQLRRQMLESIERQQRLQETEEMLRVQIEEYQDGQQLLNKANQTLQTLFDVSPLAILIASASFDTIREVNHTFTNDFGYSEESVLGKTCLEIGLWDTVGEWETCVSAMRESQTVSGFAAKIKTYRREIRNVLMYSKLIEFNNEKCRLTVFLDVTEQTRMESQLRQTQKMEVIGQLAGGVAHDFNNMLAAIQGSSELIARRLQNDPHALKLLGNIQKAASRSAELTGQLLAFSRKGQKNSVQVSIDTTIHDAISLLERTIDKNIRLETRLAATNAFVSGDQALLQNALLNLGVNARDAMPDGGTIVFATANVCLDHDACVSSHYSITPGAYISISVSDTGVGMTPEILQQVFEPFFTTKEVGKGTGLGLAAVYSTVIDHHGSITISSEPGVGTLFTLYLPQSGPVIKDGVLRKEITRGSGGILLVDDEAMLRDVGKSILESLGYKVFLADDGTQALEVYTRERKNISLVILDMVMPNMGGRDTLMRLKELYPNVCVLISSGYHEEGTAEDLETLGAVGFLQKPYGMPDLCKALADVFK